MADQHSKSKSRYTEDRRIPGAFEGETVTRRRFMSGTVNAAGAAMMAAIALPALGFAVGPVFARDKAIWQVVGSVGDFTPDSYAPKTIDIVQGVGEPGKSTAFVRKHNPKVDGPIKDQYDRYVAISSRCAHLGCPVRWVEAAERFICPCHGGVYDFRGSRTGGPPVRPLDRFYTKVVDGKVLVGPRYSVNSEFRRFSPRDPGEPLDGIGQYLYPARFSTAKK